MVTHEIELEVHKETDPRPQEVVVRVGDVGTQEIDASILRDGSSYSPTLKTARLDILKADGTWCRCSATLSGSVAKCTLPSQAVSSPGTARLAHFVFTDGSSAESTEGFVLKVLPNVDASGAESENYSDEMEALYRKWLALEQDAEKAESARKSAESARASAETARKIAESSRASAEASRASAEKTRASEFSTLKSQSQAATSAANSAAASANSSASKASAAAEDATEAAEEARAAAGMVSQDKTIFLGYDLVGDVNYLTLTDESED